jgi:hypothetical protein
MLIYHFCTKDHLVADVLHTSIGRSTSHIAAMPPSADLRAAVLDLWAVSNAAPVDGCNRIYVEASALGLLGREPYASGVREGNTRWMAAIVGHLTRSGVDQARAVRAAELIDAAFMGFQLDLPLDLDPAARTRTVTDLADTLAALP